jgi:hypothetical protein
VAAPRRVLASRPLKKREPMAPPSAPAAPPPIERIVIQVDEPWAPPTVSRTLTHITIVAAGVPEAPGAQLTVVKHQVQEALP